MRCSPTRLLIGVGACVAFGAVPALAAPDAGPPVVTHVRITHSRFRVGTQPVAQMSTKRAGGHKAPIGTTFKLNVSERSMVVVGIVGRVGRGKLDEKCLDAIVTGRGCPGLIATGFSRLGKGPGKVSIPFSGRIGTTSLPPGTYEAGVEAVDASDRSSDLKLVHFKIVK